MTNKGDQEIVDAFAALICRGPAFLEQDGLDVAVSPKLASRLRERFGETANDFLNSCAYVDAKNRIPLQQYECAVQQVADWNSRLNIHNKILYQSPSGLLVERAIHECAPEARVMNGRALVCLALEGWVAMDRCKC